MRTLRAWHARGTWTFAGRLAGIGAVAGLASWVLAAVLQFVFGLPRPTLMALVLAVPRGALFGVIFALVLGALWDRKTPRRRRP
ncbi:MAG: hypothetical protein OER90_04400 [Gemmatimonadota bacterium]|nr:hypothetical protein [Gemmatimonadota bacterium]